MSELFIVHRPYSAFASPGSKPAVSSAFLMWETCRRQIFFSEESAAKYFSPHPEDEIFLGIDAEAFLMEVLCGLRSPLLGETEVFGQFKSWWQNLPAQEFKKKYSPTIQQIYSMVKKIREETLCGLGSQSYGSLLRRKVQKDETVDFIGAGQLVEEMTPWIQKKSNYRIWCRDTAKVSQTSHGQQAQEVLGLGDSKNLAAVVVIAAPLEHGFLTEWLQARGLNANTRLYDFRRDSQTFELKEKIREHLHLDHFVTEVEGHREEILNQVARARSRIELWQEEARSRAQVRPFGWDDL